MQAQGIPKQIHYCWFGKRAVPRLMQRCMRSWYTLLPDYVFMEWNESNFDIEAIPYVREAYAQGKYAFVSDYVRLHALYHHGGIYLDMDVEVIRSLDDLLGQHAFTGFEDRLHLQAGTMGSAKESSWIKGLLEDYQQRHFLSKEGVIDCTTITQRMTQLALGQGLVQDGERQLLTCGVTVYPSDCFSPYDYINGGELRTAQTYTVHHFVQSWLPPTVRWRSRMKRRVASTFGARVNVRLRQLLHPIRSESASTNAPKDKRGAGNDQALV